MPCVDVDVGVSRRGFSFCSFLARIILEGLMCRVHDVSELFVMVFRMMLSGSVSCSRSLGMRLLTDGFVFAMPWEVVVLSCDIRDFL